jgi:hypothetical protein
MANPVGAISNVQQVNPTTQPVAAKPAVNGRRPLGKTASTSVPQEGQPDNAIEAANRCGPRRRQQVIPEGLAQHVPSLIGARAARTRAAISLES